MRLLVKFVAILALILGCGLAITAFAARDFLRNNARLQVEEQAKLMMEAATAMRHYTTDHIKPLVPEQSESGEFVEETVPAFAASTTFDYLRKNFSKDYTYKEAAPNPTNPDDRALDWEMEVIGWFKNYPDQTERYDDHYDESGKKYLYYARPVRAEKSCLRCHSRPEEAPRSLTDKYGPANGFHWRENEVVAAQIVTVPTDLPERRGDKAFWQLMMTLGLVTTATVLSVGGALVLTVIRPVLRLSAAAEEVSKGNLTVGTLPVVGKDEIAELTASFNRMYRSLLKAIKLLKER